MMYSLKEKNNKTFYLSLVFVNSSASFCKNTLLGLAKGYSGFAVQGVGVGGSFSSVFWNLYSVILIKFYHTPLWMLFLFPIGLYVFTYPLFILGYENLGKHKLTQLAL
jgi:hypothetical protein